MSFVIIYGKGPEFIYKLLQHKYKTKKWEEVKKNNRGRLIQNND